MQTDLEAMERAMQLERNGRSFYLEAAERTSSEEGRKMFLSLADDEALHLRLFQKQYESLKDDRGWQALEEMGQPAADWNDPIFPIEPAKFEKAVHPLAGDLDALAFGISIEHDSIEMYRGLAAQVTDPAGQQMYRWLATVERGHFNQLMLNYEHILNSGHWGA